MNRTLPRTTMARSAAALFVALACGHAAAELVLYEHDDFDGRPVRAYGPVGNLNSMAFNDMASSAVVRSGSWQVCSDADFRGQCITLSPGSYPSLRAMGLNDRISSVRPSGGGGNWGGGWGGGGGGPVELYEHVDYGGRSISSSGEANLSRRSFNDTASSIVIRSGRWEFCVDADYRGRCITLGPGNYGNLVDMGLNDQISSLRPTGGPPSWGNGRPPGGGWGGDDESAPQVVMAGRAGRVVFNNGCVVYYNAGGQRFQNLPACHGRQIPRADDAMARYRREQGLDGPVADEHPWAGAGGGGAGDPTPPEIIAGTNREAEVIFRNNCVVYYNAQGRRYKQQPTCSPGQVRRADSAIAAYRREQGW